jgi:hypothetical protein
MKNMIQGPGAESAKKIVRGMGKGGKQGSRSMSGKGGKLIKTPAASPKSMKGGY